MRIRERFNPRAPCGARPGCQYVMRPYQGHFNPRAPCGARRFPLSIFLPEHGEFQPTRPLRGATIKGLSAQVKELFQPTRPLRGATKILRGDDVLVAISTHAPLAGRDSHPADAVLTAQLISTHAPLAGRDRCQS